MNFGNFFHKITILMKKVIFLVINFIINRPHLGQEYLGRSGNSSKNFYNVSTIFKKYKQKNSGTYFFSMAIWALGPSLQFEFTAVCYGLSLRDSRYRTRSLRTSRYRTRSLRPLVTEPARSEREFQKFLQTR